MEETVPESLGRKHDEEPELHRQIQEGLRGIIDPGTGLDVVRMGLVCDTELQPAGRGYRAIITFRPSSPVCPMAFKLAWEMKQRVQAVENIEAVEVRVEGFNRGPELEALLRGEASEQEGSNRSG